MQRKKTPGCSRCLPKTPLKAAHRGALRWPSFALTLALARVCSPGKVSTPRALHGGLWRRCWRYDLLRKNPARFFASGRKRIEWVLANVSQSWPSSSQSRLIKSTSVPSCKFAFNTFCQSEAVQLMTIGFTAEHQSTPHTILQILHQLIFAASIFAQSGR